MKDSIPVLDLTPEIESLWDDLNKAVQEVMRSGMFIMGPAVKEFEENVAEYLGTKHAIGVNSGTDALVIGLRAAGVGQGDEVITTAFTFFATAESISIVGAEPVFVDIDPQSFNIDPAKIEQAITDRTKAIMPVHLYGNAAAMTQIMEIAERHNLIVIEDCAQSFGATYHGDCEKCEGDNCSHNIRKDLVGKQTGTVGHVGAYSFFPSKNLGAYGDGGLLVTDDDEIAEIAGMLRTHGSKKKYHNEILGYNSRLDSIQAAILNVKLPHLDSFNEGRRSVAQRYNEMLADVDEIITPHINKGNVFHQYTIRITQSNRDEIRRKMKDEGVSSMVYYPIPCDDLPVYNDISYDLPQTEMLTQQVLSLPIWPQMEEKAQERVVESLKKTLQK